MVGVDSPVCYSGNLSRVDLRCEMIPRRCSAGVSRSMIADDTRLWPGTDCDEAERWG